MSKPAQIDTFNEPSGAGFSAALSLESMPGTLLRSWGWLVLSAALFMALGLVALFFMPQTYAAAFHVVPAATVSPQQSGSTSRALAGLLGSGGGEGDATPFLQYRFALTSEVVAQRVINDHPALLRAIFANEWDSVSQTWRPPASLTRHITAPLAAMYGLPSWRQPDANRLAAVLQKVLTFSIDMKTHVVEVSFSAADRSFAIEVLNVLHQETIAYLRATKLAATQLQLAYLQKAIRDVSTVEERKVLTEMMVTAELDMLTCQEGMPFVVQVLDVPSAPALPSSPRPLFFLVVATLSGMALTALVVIGRDFWMASRRARSHSPSQ